MKMVFRLGLGSPFGLWSRGYKAQDLNTNHITHWQNWHPYSNLSTKGFYFLRNQYYAPFNNFGWPIKTLAKNRQEGIPTSWKKNNQDGGLFFFILPIIINKHPVSKPITKLARMDTTEEVEICQKRKLRTTGWVFWMAKISKRMRRTIMAINLALIY